MLTPAERRERRKARLKERLRRREERRRARLGLDVDRETTPAPTKPKPKEEPTQWSTAPQAASETKALKGPKTSTAVGAQHPDRPGLVVIGKYKNKSGKPRYGSKAEYKKRNK
jgi:hypothetical protein